MPSRGRFGRLALQPGDTFATGRMQNALRSLALCIAIQRSRSTYRTIGPRIPFQVIEKCKLPLVPLAGLLGWRFATEGMNCDKQPTRFGHAVNCGHVNRLSLNSRLGFETWCYCFNKLLVGESPRPASRPPACSSQTWRQFFSHFPWHLNSCPLPPMLPPHSGQMQFIMLEITSEAALKAFNLRYAMYHPLSHLHNPHAVPVQARKRCRIRTLSELLRGRIVTV